MERFLELSGWDFKQSRDSFSEKSNWNLWYDFVPNKDLGKIYKHNFSYGIASPVLYR